MKKSIILLSVLALGFAANAQVYERTPRKYDFELSDIARRITPVLSFNANMHADGWIWKEGRSSALVEKGKPADFYEINKINDEDGEGANARTAWVEGVQGDGIGEWVMIPVGTNDSDTRWHFSGNGEGGNLKVCLSVENGYQQSKDLYLKNNRVKEAKISIYAAAFSAGQDDAYLLWNPDCIHEEVITLCDEIAPEPFYFNSSYKEFFMSLPEKYSTEHIQLFLRLEIMSVYKGTKYSDTCISNMSAMVYWMDEGTGWVTEG